MRNLKLTYSLKSRVKGINMNPILIKGYGISIYVDKRKLIIDNKSKLNIKHMPSINLKIK